MIGSRALADALLNPDFLSTLRHGLGSQAHEDVHGILVRALLKLADPRCTFAATQRLQSHSVQSATLPAAVALLNAILHCSALGADFAGAVAAHSALKSLSLAADVAAGVQPARREQSGRTPLRSLRAAPELPADPARGSAAAVSVCAPAMNAWLEALLAAGKHAEAAAVFASALSHGLLRSPDSGTLAAMVRASAAQDDFRGATATWALLTAGQAPHRAPVEPGGDAFTAYAEAAGRAGLRREALSVLDRMRIAGLTPTADTYAACMTACTLTGRPGTAFALHGDMVVAGVPRSEASFHALAAAAAHAGDVELAREVVELMAAEGAAPTPVEGHTADAGAGGGAAAAPAGSVASTDAPSAAAGAVAAAGSAASSAGFQPSARIYSALVYAAARSNELALALEWLQACRDARKAAAAASARTPATSSLFGGGLPSVAAATTAVGSPAAALSAAYDTVLSALAVRAASDGGEEAGGSAAAASAASARSDRERAEALFAQMVETDTVAPGAGAVTALIRLRALSGDFPGALAVFEAHTRRQGGMLPASAAATAPLKGAPAAAAGGALAPTAEMFQALVRCAGMSGDASHLHTARALLDRAPREGVKLSVPLLNAYAAAAGEAGDTREAAGVLRRMQEAHLTPDAATFEHVLVAAASCNDVATASAAADALRGLGLTPTPRTVAALTGAMEAEEARERQARRAAKAGAAADEQAASEGAEAPADASPSRARGGGKSGHKGATSAVRAPRPGLQDLLSREEAEAAAALVSGSGSSGALLPLALPGEGALGSAARHHTRLRQLQQARQREAAAEAAAGGEAAGTAGAGGEDGTGEAGAEGGVELVPSPLEEELRRFALGGRDVDGGDEEDDDDAMLAAAEAAAGVTGSGRGSRRGNRGKAHASGSDGYAATAAGPARLPSRSSSSSVHNTISSRDDSLRGLQEQPQLPWDQEVFLREAFGAAQLDGATGRGDAVSTAAGFAVVQQQLAALVAGGSGAARSSARAAGLLGATAFAPGPALVQRGRAFAEKSFSGGFGRFPSVALPSPSASASGPRSGTPIPRLRAFDGSSVPLPRGLRPKSEAEVRTATLAGLRGDLTLSPAERAADEAAEGSADGESASTGGGGAGGLHAMQAQVRARHEQQGQLRRLQASAFAGQEPERSATAAVTPPRSAAAATQLPLAPAPVSSRSPRLDVEAAESAEQQQRGGASPAGRRRRRRGSGSSADEVAASDDTAAVGYGAPEDGAGADDDAAEASDLAQPTPPRRRGGRPGRRLKSRAGWQDVDEDDWGNEVVFDGDVPLYDGPLSDDEEGGASADQLTPSTVGKAYAKAYAARAYGGAADRGATAADSSGNAVGASAAAVSTTTIISNVLRKTPSPAPTVPGVEAPAAIVQTKARKRGALFGESVLPPPPAAPPVGGKIRTGAPASASESLSKEAPSHASATSPAPADRAGGSSRWRKSGSRSGSR
jgi:hypothetical protein